MFGVDMTTATGDEWRAPLEGCYAVIHLGGPVPIDPDLVKDKAKELAVPIIDGTRALLNACAEERQRPDSKLRRFVLGGVCSSVAGNLKPDFDRVWNEQDWSNLDEEMGELEEVKQRQELLVLEFIKDMPGWAAESIFISFRRRICFHFPLKRLNLYFFYVVTVYIIIFLYVSHRPY